MPTDTEREWQRKMHSVEPESLNVGELNRIVRDLREEIYQLHLRAQKAEAVIEAASAVPEAWPVRAPVALAVIHGAFQHTPRCTTAGCHD